MVNYKELCLACVEVAKKAGAFIKNERKTFSTSCIETKSSDSDLVSYVDKEAEKIVVAGLKPLIEGARFITEEKTVVACQGNSPFCWIIDPLDGTTNFAHSLPPYCVSIALVEGDEIVVGVVYEIVAGECFYSWKGGESYCNDDVISVSDTKSLSRSLVSLGFSYENRNVEEQSQHQIAYITAHTHGFRRTGSAAANIVFTACGRFDGFAQQNLAPWDVAGGILVARNAGAVVSDFSGGDNCLFGKEIIISNPYIYKEYKSLVNWDETMELKSRK